MFIVSLVGFGFVAASLLRLVRLFRKSDLARLRDAVFVAIMAVIFALQFITGLRLIHRPANGGLIGEACILVVVFFLVGISRAWELIGGPQFGVAHEATKLVLPRRSPGDEEVGADHDDAPDTPDTPSDQA